MTGTSLVNHDRTRSLILFLIGLSSILLFGCSPDVADKPSNALPANKAINEAKQKTAEYLQDRREKAILYIEDGISKSPACDHILDMLNNVDTSSDTTDNQFIDSVYQIIEDAKSRGCVNEA